MRMHTALVLTMGLLCSGVAVFGAGLVQTDMAMAQAPATGTVIIMLGTRGGPFPTKDRMQSSNLLVVNGTPYLIDAGDSVTRRIVQANYDFRKVGKIFITHPHG
jgi:glyoxylase-like metal-dependent hydrolase (beta-lactamase superfamily II)